MAAPAPAPAYVHPGVNPLLAPLNQLGNLLNTNYANSWTLREIIRNNAQHILDQLERIRMAAIQIQNRAQLAQARIPQLEARINALEQQLAAQGPGHPAPNVAALQQQIADLTAQRDDYVRWVNESLALINQYNGYIQNINALAPDNAAITALIGQINQRLRTVTDIFNLPQQPFPAAPGQPPGPPGGPYGGPGGNPPPGGPGGNVGAVNPGAGNRNMFGRMGAALGNMFGRNRGAAIAPQVNPLMAGPPQQEIRNVEPLPIRRVQNRRVVGYDSDEESEDGSEGEFIGGPAVSRSNSNSSNSTIDNNNSSRAARGNWNVIDDELEDDPNELSDVDLASNLGQANRSRASSSSSLGGKRKRTRKQRKHKGGWRLSSNKRTSSRPSSRTTRSSRSSRTSSSRSGRRRRSRRTSK